MKELVHWHYFDAKGPYTSGNTKESLTKIYLIDERGRDIVESGEVVVLSRVAESSQLDPYFKSESINGYTKRARKYGDLRRTMEESHPELENALFGTRARILEYGDYIYINIPHLSNYVNPLEEENDSFVNKHFIYKDKFDKELLLDIINHKPEALFGGVIQDYRNKYLLEFLIQLNGLYPELYEETLKESETMREIHDSISFVGQKAYVQTLSPGPVGVFETSHVITEDYYWDGKNLTHETHTFHGVKIIKSVCVDEKTFVEVQDDTTVNPETTFKH